MDANLKDDASHTTAHYVASILTLRAHRRVPLVSLFLHQAHMNRLRKLLFLAGAAGDTWRWQRNQRHLPPEMESFDALFVNAADMLQLFQLVSSLADAIARPSEAGAATASSTVLRGDQAVQLANTAALSIGKTTHLFFSLAHSLLFFVGNATLLSRTELPPSSSANDASTTQSVQLVRDRRAWLSVWLRRRSTSIAARVGIAMPENSSATSTLAERMGRHSQTRSTGIGVLLGNCRL